MTKPITLLAEQRSLEWEMVLKYEDGFLPSSEWNENMLGVVASWYARNLPREQAVSRYEDYYHRNRRRLSNRLDAAAVPTEAIEALDAVWQAILTRHLDSAS